MHEQVTVFEDS